jgi:hypothetical protein
LTPRSVTILCASGQLLAKEKEYQNRWNLMNRLTSGKWRGMSLPTFQLEVHGEDTNGQYSAVGRRLWGQVRADAKVQLVIFNLKSYSDLL